MTTVPVDTCPTGRRLIDDPYRAMAAAEALSAAGYPQHLHPIITGATLVYCMHDLDAEQVAERTEPGACPPGHLRTRDRTAIAGAHSHGRHVHGVTVNELTWVCIHPTDPH